MSKYLCINDPKALKNGIKIDDIYQVEGKYVYQGRVYHRGTSDNIKTRWITNNQWDGKGSFRMVSGEMLYTDGNDNEMKVLEEDDDEWDKYDNPNMTTPNMTTNRRINRRNDMELWYQQESGSNGMQDWMYDSETDDYFGPGPAALRDD